MSKIEKEANKFYRQGEIILTDKQYDRISKEQLMEEPGKEPLPYIAGSLKKIKTEKDLDHFISKKNIRAIFGSAKVDGMSLITEWKNGTLVKALTRGDGKTGQNVTEIVQQIVSPKKNFSGIVRGELVIFKKDFLELQKLGYSTPRNAVAGIVNRKEVTKEVSKLIHYLAYEIMDSDQSIMQQFTTLQQYDFEVPQNFSRKVDSSLFVFLKDKLESFQDLPYEVDGIVICDIRFSNDHRSLIPNDIVAFKQDKEGVWTTVTDVVWKMNRMGFYIPVVEISPVQIANTVISRVTGYNYRFIDVNNITAGTKVEVIKAGEVIPKINDVEEKEKKQPLNNPKRCVHCDTELTIEGVHLKCPNPECPEKKFQALLDFLCKLDVNFAKENNLRKWKITSVEDIIALRPQGKQQEKFVKSFKDVIHSKTEQEVFYSLPWTNAAEATFTALYEFYGFDKVVLMIRNRETPSEFPKGIGPKTWQQILEDAEITLPIYNTIISFFRLNEETDKKQPSKVLSFCITGKLSKPRKDVENMIKKAGHKITGLTKGTDYLIAGEKPGSKIDKAKELGVKIITEEELYNILKEEESK